MCVVVGAHADEVRAQLLPTEIPVHAPEWETGMGASLRAGLTRLTDFVAPPDAALIHLVDLPDVPAAAVRRVLGHTAPHVVARACYGGVPGHPVLLGRHWWEEVRAALSGDSGAREWLRDRTDLRLIECGDLATGDDVDTPRDLNSYAERRDDS